MLFYRNRNFLALFLASSALLTLCLGALWFSLSDTLAGYQLSSELIRRAFLTAFGLGILANVAVCFWFTRRVQSDLHDLSTIMRELAGGQLAVRSSGVAGDYTEITEALNRLGDEVQRRVTDLEVERNGLKAILSAMEEGLLVVDGEQRVLMANPAARRMLSFPDLDPAGRPLPELVPQADLLDNVHRSLSSSQSCSFEFQFNAADGSGRRHLLARCAPFREKTFNGAVAVLHDITELRRLERVRTEFVANVSHELRTPLTSLLGYLETLQEGGADADQTAKFLLVCRRQAERLSGIVEDLLRLSRLENPQQEMALAELDLEEVVNTAVEHCRELAEARKVAVRVHLPGRGSHIMGDRGLLVQAIANLVENAINYNRDNGRVDVRLRADPKQGILELSVTDTGIGISPEALGRIFERFYRVDKARSRETGGTGLGLSIVRHIALAHGASLHVESEIDKGSTFYMRFKSKEHEHQPASAA